MTLRILSPIHKATRQIGLHLADRTAELGVSNEEAHILSYLESYSPAPIYELQRVFGHRPSTLTGMIDRLESRELVRRQRNPDDRRSFLIRLTDRGRGLAGEVSGLVERLEAHVLTNVDDTAVAGFRAVMDAIGGATGVEIRPVGASDVRVRPIVARQDEARQDEAQQDEAQRDTEEAGTGMRKAGQL